MYLITETESTHTSTPFYNQRRR